MIKPTFKMDFFMSDMDSDLFSLDLSVCNCSPVTITFDTLSIKKDGFFVKNYASIKKYNEIVPLNPSLEMLKAALGDKYSEEKAFELKKMWRNMIHEHQRVVHEDFYKD